jgi:endoglucanase
MTDLLPFLKSLMSVSGLSAYEMPVARLIENEWRPLVDELHYTRLGSLHALKRGTGSGRRPVLLISAHMDAIGMMVSRIEDGFIHILSVGDMDVRVLPGTAVLVHAGSGPLPGVVAMPPPHLLPEDQRGRFPEAEYLVVDTGLPASQVRRRVRVGDLVSIDTQPVELAGGVLSGHSADNRASIAAITLALQDLKGKSHAWDIWAAATVQEETTFAGGHTSTFQLKPDMAVVLDVTFGKGPGANTWESFALDNGPTLGVGPNIHPYLFERFKQLSEKAGMNLPVEPMPGLSGTETEAVQLSEAGLPTMLMEIPLRYMHTPVEVVALNDIRRLGRLLSDFVLTLEEDFLERLEWS